MNPAIEKLYHGLNSCIEYLYLPKITIISKKLHEANRSANISLENFASEEKHHCMPFNQWQKELNKYVENKHTSNS